jgi:hypothetical protein
MRHKCGQPITKETAIANIYLTLLKEDEKSKPAMCTRVGTHKGPCNGLEREDCIHQAVKDLRNFEQQVRNNEIEPNLDVHAKLAKDALPYL